MALLDQIQTALAPFDAKALASQIESIPTRRAAVAAVKDRVFTGQYATNQRAYARIEAAGGKGWLELLWGQGDAAVAACLTKQEEAKAEARNLKLAAKLIKAGVTDVAAFESAYSANGFEGRWSFETNTGLRHVYLTVIGAGGYNIQCYHFRVLVRVI